MKVAIYPRYSSENQRDASPTVNEPELSVFPPSHTLVFVGSERFTAIGCYRDNIGNCLSESAFSLAQI